MAEPSELTQGFQPLTYGQVRSFYDYAQKTNPHFAGLSLADFSKQANAELDTNAFQAGTSTGLKSLAKRFSLGFDQLIEPVSEFTGGLAGGVAELLGASPDIQTLSEELGHAFPRGLIETGAAIGGAALATGTAPISVPLGVGLIGAGALSAASGGIEKTDSTLVGLIQGGATAALPGAANLGTKLISEPLIKQLTMRPVLTRVGDKMIENMAPQAWASEFARGVTQRGLEYLGPNIGATALQEASMQLTSVAQGQGLQDPLTFEHALTLFGANLPFALIDAGRVLRQPRPTAIGPSGARVDFQSATEAREAQKYATVLEAKANYETAKEIDTFLRSLNRKALPPTRRMFFGGDVGGDLPTIDPTGGSTPIRPGAIDAGGNVMVPSELFSKWGQALELTPRKRVFDKTSLAPLGLSDVEADQILTLMEQRGYLGPADPTTGQRPVLKRVAATTYDLLDQITRTLSPRMTRPAPIQGGVPRPAPQQVKGGEGSGKEKEGTEKGKVPVLTTPTQPVAATPAASKKPFASKVQTKEGTRETNYFDTLKEADDHAELAKKEGYQVLFVGPTEKMPTTAAAISGATAASPLWPAKVLTMKKEGKSLTDIYGVLSKENPEVMGQPGSYRQVADVFLRGEMPRASTEPDAWYEGRDKYLGDRPATPAVRAQSGEVIPGNSHQDAHDKAVAAGKIPTATQNVEWGWIGEDRKFYPYDDIFTTLLPERPQSSTEPPATARPFGEAPRPGETPAVEQVSPQEAALRSVYRGQPTSKGVPTATSGAKPGEEPEGFVPITELSAYHTAWLAKLGAFSKAVPGEQAQRPPLEGPVFPVEGGIERQPLGAPRGNEIEQLVAQVDAISPELAEGLVDSRPFNELSPIEAADRVINLARTIREITDQAAKGHTGRFRMKSEAQLLEIARGFRETGLSEEAVASRMYQIQMSELNKGLTALTTEAVSVLDSLVDLPLETLKVKERNIREKLAKLKNLPGEEVGPDRLNMQQEIVDLTTQRQEGTSVTYTHDPITGEPLAEPRTVQRAGVRVMRKWITERVRTDANRAGIMDAMYGSAVDFNENREALIAKWKEANPEKAAEMSPVEIERQAFRKHVFGMQVAKGQRGSGINAALAETVREEAKTAARLEALEKGKMLPGRFVSDTDDKGALVYSLTPEQEAANAADAAYSQRIRVLMNRVPPRISESRSVELREEATGIKTQKKDREKFTRNFNIALDLLREGHLGIRQGPQGDQIYVVESQEMTHDMVTQMLGFQKYDATQSFLRDDFLPTVKALVAKTKEMIAMGADPMVHMSTEPATMSPEQEQRLALAREAGVPAQVFEPQTGPDAGLNLIIGAREFFQKWYESRGVGKDEAAFRTETAMRVAAMFDKVGYVRIAELVRQSGPNEGGVEGLFLANRGRANDAFIGLSRDAFLRLPEPVQRFAMLKTFSHEVWHGMTSRTARLDPVTSKTVEDIRDWANTRLGPAEREELIKDTYQLLIPKELYKDNVQHYVEHRGMQAANDPEEFLSDYVGMLVGGLASPDRSVALREFQARLVTNQPVANFAKGFYANISEMTSGIAAYYDYRAARGLGGNSGAVADSVRFLNQQVRSTLNDLKAVDQAVRMIREMEQYDPVRYFDLVSRANIPGPIGDKALLTLWDKLVGTGMLWQMSTEPTGKDYIDSARVAMGFQSKRALEEAFGVQPRWYERWFFPAAQLSERYPVLKPAIDLAFEYRTTAERLKQQMLAPWMTKTQFGRPVLDAERSGLNAAFNDEGINWAITRIALVKNERGFAGEKAGLKGAELEKAGLMTDAQMKALMPELSPERQQRVIDFHRNAEVAMPIAAAKVISAHTASVIHQTALRLMVKQKTLGSKQALNYATEIVGNAMEMMSTDPVASAAATQRLAQLQTRLEPELFAAGFDTAKALIPSVQTLAEHLAGKPWYTTEVRPGKYVVAWKDGVRGFDDVLLANRYKAELEAKGTNARVIDKFDKRSQTSGLRDDYVTMWSRVEDAAMKRALVDFGLNTPEMQEFMRVGYRPGETMAREKASRGIGKFMLPRKLAGGRETINTAEGVIDYITSTADGLAKQFTREQVGLALSDPTIRDQPKARELARAHLDTVLNPPTNEWTAFKNMNFLYFMGYNLSSMLMETSQPLMSLAPYLTSKAIGDKQIGVVGSYKAIADGVQTLTKAMQNKGKFENPEVEKAVAQARQEQILDFGILQEFYLNQDNPVMNVRHLMAGDSAVSKGADLLKRPFFWWLHSARWLYSLPTRANSHIAFVSAFQAAKARGLEYRAAYDFATQTTRATMFGGGQAARPVDLFANSGKWHGAVGAVYSLQSYTFSMISMMARLAESSLGRVPGMSPGEKTAARKAFAQMMVTQLAAAGAMGLPFAAGGIALIEQMFPEAEVRKNMRKWLTGLAGEDEKTGRIVTDLAMNGVVNYFTGLDVASRLSLGQALGVDSYKGFSVSNLVGPIGGVLENLFRGGSELARGDLAEAGKAMVPRALRGLVTMQSDDWAFRDKGGRLIDNASQGEQLMYVLGVTPKKIKDYWEESALTRRSEDIVGAQLNRFHSELADRLAQGDVVGVRDSLLMRAKEDSNYNPRAGARRVVEVLQDKTIPVDPARSGRRSNAIERSEIARTFQTRPQPTEQQRLSQRWQLEQSLTGSASMSPTEMMIATYVDRLMSMNPTLSRQQALILVEQQLHPRSWQIPAGSPGR